MIIRAFPLLAVVAMSATGCGAAQPGYATQEEFEELEERVNQLDGGGSGDSESGGEAAGEQGEAPHWTYAEAEEWGEIAAEYETCGSGREQSPIDLSNPLISAEHPPTLAYTPSAATVTDNGHTVQVDVAAGGSITIGEQQFSLKQFHFHAPSEHTVNGEHSPLEIHYVHADAEGHLAVIGVMVVEGEAYAGFDEIIGLVPAPGEKADLTGQIDVTSLLPGELVAYRYPGSLTTPPCSEGVTWTVLAQPISWSADQIKSLTSRFVEPNNRPVQDEEDRDVEFLIS